MSDYQDIFLNQWQLERGGIPFNPFNVQPPPTPEERAAVFTGPEDDLESVTSQMEAISRPLIPSLPWPRGKSRNASSLAG